MMGLCDVEYVRRGILRPEIPELGRLWWVGAVRLLPTGCGRAKALYTRQGASPQDLALAHPTLDASCQLAPGWLWLHGAGLFSLQPYSRQMAQHRPRPRRPTLMVRGPAIARRIVFQIQSQVRKMHKSRIQTVSVLFAQQRSAQQSSNGRPIPRAQASRNASKHDAEAHHSPRTPFGSTSDPSKPYR